MPNVFRPVFEPPDGRIPYAAIGRLAGARGVDLDLYRLEPGDEIELPAGRERVLVVSRGAPTVDGRLHLVAGDVWVWPESGAGVLANRTAETAEVLVVVSRPATAVRGHATASRSGSGRAPARRRP